METIGRNDACWCGSGKKYKKCHCQFDEKLKELQQEGHFIPSHDMIKTPEQIEKIKESGKINIAVLDYVAEHIKAGITTQQIDDWVYEQTTSRGAIPAPLNYEGFPKSVCTSVNDQVCHGIPSEDVVLQVVYPAAGMIDYFKGKYLAVLNRDATSRDKQADLCITDPIGEVLGRIRV